MMTKFVVTKPFYLSNPSKLLDIATRCTVV